MNDPEKQIFPIRRIEFKGFVGIFFILQIFTGIAFYNDIRALIIGKREASKTDYLTIISTILIVGISIYTVVKYVKYENPYILESVMKIFVLILMIDCFNYGIRFNDNYGYPKEFEFLYIFVLIRVILYAIAIFLFGFVKFCQYCCNSDSSSCCCCSTRACESSKNVEHNYPYAEVLISDSVQHK